MLPRVRVARLEVEQEFAGATQWFLNLNRPDDYELAQHKIGDS
jgi:molybdopterin-guanine dinucleotide biosynthesis protein A